MYRRFYFMGYKHLSDEELALIKGGEAITISSVLAIMAIGLVAVITFKFFSSTTGKAVFPGGFTFQWD